MKPGVRAVRLSDLPIATLLIIAANVVVYILTSRSAADFENAVIDYGLIPAQFRIGRMITSTVVHDGVLHLVTNMTLLYIFGSDVERAMGKLEYVLFYLGACVAASVLHVAIVFAALPVLYETRGIVGASGAVAGVMGVYAVRFHRKCFNFGEVHVPALMVIALWLVAQVILAILGLYADPSSQQVGRIGYWSHLGGFAFGMVIALVTNMALQGEREHLISEAKRHYDEGNLLECTQNYEQLLRYDPDNAYAHAELGRLWGILEEEEQSLPFYGAAVELYLVQGNEELALQTADEMKRFWPASDLPAPTRVKLATYLEESGEIDRAVSALEQIVSSDGESIQAQMSLLKIGQLQLTALSDPASAITTLKSFLERFPDSEWRAFAQETLAQAEKRAT